MKNPSQDSWYPEIVCQTVLAGGGEKIKKEKKETNMFKKSCTGFQMWKVNKI
jgi:hypothetical protein